MSMIKGTLIPIGGNEDKGFEDDEIHRLDYIEEGILAHVVEEAGGINAKIVVIPTASSIPIEVGENYTTAFSTLGCKHIDVLNIKSKEELIGEIIGLLQSPAKNVISALQSGGGKIHGILQTLSEK